jgi:hypothetical protein
MSKELSKEEHKDFSNYLKEAEDRSKTRNISNRK